MKSIFTIVYQKTHNVIHCNSVFFSVTPLGFLHSLHHSAPTAFVTSLTCESTFEETIGWGELPAQTTRQ